MAAGPDGDYAGDVHGEVLSESSRSLRHMAATQKHAKADKDALAKKLAESLTPGQIASLLGHSETKTTKGYVHY